MSRILVVEDEVGIRMTIEDRLKAEGYEVEVAEDGVSGYERVRAGGIDLVVLDLMLPKKPGLDICRDLRGAGIVTPVLMLTAKGQVMDRVKGLRTGADDYFGFSGSRTNRYRHCRHWRRAGRAAGPSMGFGTSKYRQSELACASANGFTISPAYRSKAPV